MAIMAMRKTAYGIQTSVYVVYLKQVGPVGTTIGILFGAAEIASAAGALFAGRAMRLSDAQRTTLSGSALMIPELSLRPPRSLVTALRCPEHVPSTSRTLPKAAGKSNFSRSGPVLGLPQRSCRHDVSCFN